MSENWVLTSGASTGLVSGAFLEAVQCDVMVLLLTVTAGLCNAELSLVRGHGFIGFRVLRYKIPGVKGIS